MNTININTKKCVYDKVNIYPESLRNNKKTAPEVKSELLQLHALISSQADAYTPQIIRQLSNSITPDLNDKMVSMEQMILLLIPISKNQLKATMSVANLENTILNLTDEVMKTLADLATELQNKIETEFNQVLQLRAEQNKHHGILAAIFGGIEAVIGVALMATGSEVIGAFMLVNGICKMAAGISVIINPDNANNDWCTQFMDHGIFAILKPVGGDKLVSTSETIFDTAMMIFALTDSILSDVKTLADRGATTSSKAMATVSLANSGAMLTGMIYQLLPITHDNDDLQSCAMGIFSLIIHTVMKKLGLDKTLEGELIEGVGGAILMIAIIGVNLKQKINTADAEGGNGAFSEFRELVLKALSKLMLHQVVKQANNSAQQVSDADTQYDISCQLNNINFESSVFNIKNSLIKYMIEQNNTSVTNLGKTESDMAKQGQQFFQYISDIIRIRNDMSN